MEIKTALSFDDVLLVPQYSEIKSRKDVDVSTYLNDNLTLKIPIISSCMDTVTEEKMATAMWYNGGLGILHRYNTIDKQIDMYEKVRRENADCAVAIGATGDYYERAVQLINAGVSMLCIDVANGHNTVCIEAVKKISYNFRNVYGLIIIAGNVATGDGAIRLLDAGAHAIRVGIGGGSLCTTRLVSGNGVPTLQSIFDCVEHLDRYGYRDYFLIADGGVKNSGDMVKAFAAGAKAVMVGQLLAATDESPGNIIEKNNKKYKSYRGMASFVAQNDWRPEQKEEIVPEGEDTILPYKGPVDKILYRLVGGIRSGMSYCNSTFINELKHQSKFIKITSAGWAESKPHAKEVV